MNMLIYGAGVQGTVLALRLHAAGHDVSLLARGKRLANLREHGIVVEDARINVRSTAQVTIIESLGPEDHYDLIVVAMRKNQIPEILPVLAANKSENILFLGNNAAGPEALVAVLGRDRVLLGFAGIGGTRQDHVVRAYIPGNSYSLTLGELHGRVTPRLRVIMQAFTEAGAHVEACTNIDAWLKTHAALILPLACAVHATGGDRYRLSNSRDALVLTVRAFREALHVLRVQGIMITPPSAAIFDWIPEPVIVFIFSQLGKTERVQLAVISHAMAAPDEMRLLAEEFAQIKQMAAVDTPAYDSLVAYLSEDQNVMPAYSSTIALRWQGLAMWVTGLILGWNLISNIVAFMFGRSSAKTEN